MAIIQPKKKVLLLDTAFSAMPIYQYLVEVGFEVWTIGNRPLDPLATCLPSNWIDLDYSNIELVQSLLDDSSFDFVVPGCTDISMNTYVNLKLQKPHSFTPKVDETLNKKNLFRELCSTLNLPAPKVKNFYDLPSYGKYVCKPVDSFSGKGITIFEASHKEQAHKAYQLAKEHSPSQQVLCENYVEGQLYSYSAFVKHGFVEQAFVVKEGSLYDSFSVDTSYVVDQNKIPHNERLQRIVEKISKHLELCDGLVHTQFIASEKEIALLEITRRCPGDLYSKLIENSTGYPYAAKYASAFVKQEVANYDVYKRYILRHTIKQTGPSKFTGFNLKYLNGKIVRIVPVMGIGDPISFHGYQRTGVIFIEESNSQNLETRFLEIIENNNFEDAL